MNKKPIPEVGKFYHFWDDGKISESRHYICKCERIITPEEAKEIMVEIPDWDFDHKVNISYETSLYNHWHDNEMPNHDWLYNKTTDYFIECSCPKYDENNLWFVRTKDGGWFSIDVQSSWMSGRLDINGEILESVIEEIKKYPEYYCEDAIEIYTNISY